MCEGLIPSFVSMKSNPSCYGHYITPSDLSYDSLEHNCQNWDHSSMLRDKSSLLWFFILHFVFARCQLPHLQPGDLAPSFALQTLDGRIVYRKSNSSSKAPRHPVILHLFTRRSAFLEALWNNETSLEEFIESSPANTHFVFMSSSDSKSVEDVLWMRSQLHGAINKYYKRFVWISGSPRSLFRSEAV